jgi:predicted nucleic acid-binding protein
VYLVDTDVISEARKKRKANKGVSAFFRQAVWTAVFADPVSAVLHH